MQNPLIHYREAILDAARRFHVAEVRLFGSYVRGEANAGSDVDLLIRLEPEAENWPNYIGFVHAVEDILETPVDVVTEEGLSPHMRPYILAEARPL